MQHPSISKTPSAWQFLSIAIVTIICILTTHKDADAQTFKWVDANGKSVYSDTPPPAHAKKLISKSGDSAEVISTVKLPPELAAAVSKNPVVFYSAANCEPCNDARTMLKKNGIPFAEKTIKTNADLDKLKAVSGDTQLPLITINKSKFSGYDADGWRTALSAGGYPETSILPKDYTYPNAESAAPELVAKKQDGVKAVIPVAPRSSSPTGIRF